MNPSFDVITMSFVKILFRTTGQSLLQLSMRALLIILILAMTTPALAQDEDPSVLDTGTREWIDNNRSIDDKVILPTDELQDDTTDFKTSWEKAIPPTDKFDWIQLTSDEWLKGEIKVLYNKVMEFDSDELGLLQIDLEDIKQIHGRGIKGVRLEGPITVFGELVITGDKVIISDGDTQRTYDRSKLISITKGETRELSLWSAKLSLGLDLTSGNTEQTNYSSKLNLKRRTPGTRFNLDYLGNFSSTRGEDTVDNNRLNGFFDKFKSRRFYWRPGFGEYYRDPFQNIAYRYTLGAGGGYQAIDSARRELIVGGGLAYQETRFDSVEAGQDERISSPALVVSTRYETELNKRLDFKINYSFNIVNEESGQYTHHMITTLETEIISWLDFDVSFVWDRIQEPTASADGTVPESDDYQLMFLVGLEY
jgi:hypothetical protein